MCQGAAYELWCTKEFPQMKQYVIVNEIYSSAHGGLTVFRETKRNETKQKETKRDLLHMQK